MVIRQRPATLQFWDCSGTGSDSGVVLDSRVQTLTQSLSDCVVNVTVSGLAGTGTCDFTSTIQLILQTTSAHGYNFIFPNLGVGTYYFTSLFRLLPTPVPLSRPARDLQWAALPTASAR